MKKEIMKKLLIITLIMFSTLCMFSQTHFNFVGGAQNSDERAIYFCPSTILEKGDEIATFCLGKMNGHSIFGNDSTIFGGIPGFYVGNQHIVYNSLYTGSGQIEWGYEDGEKIEMVAWDVSEQKEINLKSPGLYPHHGYPGHSFMNWLFGVEIIVDDVGITENNIDFSIYPNPVVDFLKIETEHKIQNIQIIDLNGKVILEDYGKDYLDLSTCSKGLYIMSIKLNETYIQQKILIK